MSRSGEVLTKFPGHATQIHSLAPLGPTVVSGGLDGSLAMWPGVLDDDVYTPPPVARAVDEMVQIATKVNVNEWMNPCHYYYNSDSHIYHNPFLSRF